jgi:hypothetical protein
MKNTRLIYCVKTFMQLHLVLLLLTAIGIGVDANEVPQWRMSGVLDSVRMSKTSFSAAKWIWTGKRIRPNQVAYFRCRFDLPESYKSDGNTKLQIKVDDVCEEMYLNGRKISADDFALVVRPGRNVFALKAKNG